MELLKSNNGGILYYLYENLGEIQCDIFLSFATKQVKGMNSIIKSGL